MLYKHIHMVIRLYWIFVSCEPWHPDWTFGAVELVSLKNSSHKVTMSGLCRFSFLYFAALAPGCPQMRVLSTFAISFQSVKKKTFFTDLLAFCIDVIEAAKTQWFRCCCADQSVDLLCFCVHSILSKSNDFVTEGNQRLSFALDSRLFSFFQRSPPRLTEDVCVSTVLKRLQCYGWNWCTRFLLKNDRSF